MLPLRSAREGFEMRVEFVDVRDGTPLGSAYSVTEREAVAGEPSVPFLRNVFEITDAVRTEFDPATGVTRYEDASSSRIVPSFVHRAVRLPEGRVLVEPAIERLALSPRARRVRWVQPVADGIPTPGVDMRVAIAEVTPATVYEVTGARLDVEVVDDAGREVAFSEVALLAADGKQHVEVSDDGEQRLDAFVDVHGRRSFTRVRPGAVTVVAKRGHAEAREEVDLLDGQRKALRLELR